MKLNIGALLLTLTLSSVASEPELHNAEFTVPYPELKALLLAARTTEKPMPPKPPVDAVLTTADYQLTPTRGQTRIEATYALRILRDGWQLVPLLGGSALLESSTITPGDDVQIVNRAGTYHVLANQPTSFEIALVLSAPSPASPDWPRGTGIVITPSPATVDRLTINHSGSLPAPKPSSAAVPASTTQESSTYHLPSGQGPITIDVGPVERQDDQPAEPSTWHLDSQLVVEFDTTRLAYTVRTFASTTAGDADILTFTLPIKATEITVQEAQGLRWHIDRSTADASTVYLQWTDRGILHRQIALTYEIPQSPLAETWQLAAPAASAAGSSKNLFAIAIPDGLDLSAAGLQSSASSRRLPDWMHTAVAGAESATLESPGSPAINIDWLPRVQPADATVKTAEFATQVAADGTLLTTANYVIDYKSPHAWNVALPAENQLLACAAADKPVAPISRSTAPGVLEIPLPAPSESTTTITLSYTEKLPLLDPLSGRLSVAAPHNATCAPYELAHFLLPISVY